MKPFIRVFAFALCLAAALLAGGATNVRAEMPQQEWGTLKTWPGITTTYPIYTRNVVYGAAPFRITDTRTDDPYSDKESYETRSLSIYRAHDGAALRENQPVVFFVHGGAWTDGYENWYDFVARSFTGEKGWVTVVIDYRLTAEEVFIADEHCPDRAVCNQPIHRAQRTKAAWYPDNIADVSAALQWVSGNIAANGGHPGQIVVVGHSAGGHLVSLVATHPTYSAPVRSAIRGVISMSGAYSLTTMSMSTFGGDLDQTFRGGHVDNPELDDASPTNYVLPGAALPPFYLLHAQGELPSLQEQTVMFGAKLAALGLPYEMAYLVGYDHTSEVEALADITATPTALIVAYLERLLFPPIYLPLLFR